jgi:hypothetical protein
MLASFPSTDLESHPSRFANPDSEKRQRALAANITGERHSSAETGPVRTAEKLWESGPNTGAGDAQEVRVQKIGATELVSPNTVRVTGVVRVAGASSMRRRERHRSDGFVERAATISVKPV